MYVEVSLVKAQVRVRMSFTFNISSELWIRTSARQPSMQDAG